MDFFGDFGDCKIEKDFLKIFRNVRRFLSAVVSTAVSFYKKNLTFFQLKLVKLSKQFKDFMTYRI